MEHGRDHDNRLVHFPRNRHNNTPPDEESEVVREPRGPEAGAHVAPTRRAAEREAERHRLEREQGRFAAGEDGLARDVRAPSVTREKLDEAAREADRAVDKRA
jgi:hypothetical protein